MRFDIGHEVTGSQVVGTLEQRCGFIGDPIEIMRGALDPGRLGVGLVGGLRWAVWRRPVFAVAGGIKMTAFIIVVDEIVRQRRVQEAINVEILGYQRVVALVVLSPVVW